MLLKTTFTFDPTLQLILEKFTHLIYSFCTIPFMNMIKLIHCGGFNRHYQHLICEIHLLLLL